MKIGIDKIGFATSQYVLHLQDLAEARGIDPDKLSKGLLLKDLSIAPITEDIVTLASTAALDILDQEDRDAIDMVILASETGIDQSKAASVFVHGLLDINPFARSFEIKEACYGGTAALDYAKLHVSARPESKVLVLTSDIAKYGIGTPGEPTQGAGALAMLVSANPRILSFNEDNVAQTRDIMDFWRPNYSTTPFVDGVFSTRQYLDSLKTTWQEYQKRSQLELDDFAAFCFHLPYPKLALKGLKQLLKKELDPAHKTQLEDNFQASILYSQKVGNIYTGSLFLGLLSLLENSQSLKAGDRIALFSYGSGAVSEIFSANLEAGFKEQLQVGRLDQLDQRQALTVEDYEKIFFEQAQLDGTGSQVYSGYDKQTFALLEIKDHQRIYQKVN